MLTIHTDEVLEDGTRKVRYDPVNCKVGFLSKTDDHTAKLSVWSKGKRKWEALCPPGWEFFYWTFDNELPPPDGTKVKAWLYTLEKDGHVDLHCLKAEPRGENDQPRPTSNTAASQSQARDGEQIGPDDMVPAEWQMSRAYHEAQRAAERRASDRRTALLSVRDVLVACMTGTPITDIDLESYTATFDHMVQELWGSELPGLKT
jgi:hypothetical protein